MSQSEAAEAAPRAKSARPVEPTPTPLARLPETVGELFTALAGTVELDIDQVVPDGDGRTRLHHYAFPWPGWESWKDARRRLVHFEEALGNRVKWVPFNDSESNDGPMTLNAFAGRAFIERVTNCGDACLELKALAHDGPLPKSPMEAVGVWFGISPGALSTGIGDEESARIAKQTVRVRIFAGQEPSDPKDCIIDARDFGIGLTADEMPGTILSLNRGLKKSKPYVTGKHGQGASSTYQFSDLTLIASRKHGTNVVAYTLVEQTWSDEGGGTPKTPTYKYLTVDCKIPAVEVGDGVDFAPGTLVRHIGYNADFTAAEGDRSMYGLLLRSLAQPLFPVWLEHHFMRRSPKGKEGVPTFAGILRYGRQIRGTVNVLERAWERTLNPGESKAPQELSKILHRSSEVFKMGTWDFGGRTGVSELGQVKITYWVVDPADRSPQDVLKNWVDPNKTVIFTLDGQTHAEESRSVVTGQSGAKLWAVGKYMVVQIDCDGLAPQAKYEMFTSTREHVKDTPIKHMIMDELARRLRLDKKLEDLNSQLAASGIKKSDRAQDESISSLIKKYLKKVGLDFEKFTKRIQQWREVDEEKEVTTGKGPREDPPPIEAQEPPTFIRWRFKGESARMYPGQRYGWVFETDAPPHYWNDADPAKSKIRVLANGVEYIGGGEMKGGRVRCHFRCPLDAQVGTKGAIQAQLEWQNGAAKTATLPVEVVAKPTPKPRPPKPDPDDDEPGSGKSKTINVKIRKRDFTEVEIPVLHPIPLTREDTTWGVLGWSVDPSKVGFSIRSTGGQVQLYYNAEFPPFLDMQRRMSKRSLEDAFVQRYEVKLVLHTIFTLNYEFVDEDDASEETRKHMRSLLCAAAESLCLAAKTELEIEARVNTDSTEEAPEESAEAAAS